MIHFVYFSCGRHYDYLAASLQSLIGLKLLERFRVWVGIDKADNLSAFQISQLSRLPVQIEIVPWDRVTGHGTSTVYNEMGALRMAACSDPSCDWVAKVDSDILFIGTRVFDVVSRSRAALFGQRESEWEPLTYTQGGCYFISADWLRSQADFTIEDVRMVSDVSLSALNSRAAKRNRLPIVECPEDLAVHTLVCGRGGRVKYGSYYVPTWQIPRLAVLKGALRIQFIGAERKRLSISRIVGVLLRDHLLRMGYYSVVHFQYHKDQMLPVSKALGSVDVSYY